MVDQADSWDIKSFVRFPVSFFEIFVPRQSPSKFPEIFLDSGFLCYFLLRF